MRHQENSVRSFFEFISLRLFADMVELADTPDLGSGPNRVQVQVLLSAIRPRRGPSGTRRRSGEKYRPFLFFSFFLSLGLIRPFSVIFYPIINKKTVSELLKIYNRNIDDKNAFVYNELNASVGLLCPLVTL